MPSCLLPGKSNLPCYPPPPPPPHIYISAAPINTFSANFENVQVKVDVLYAHFLANFEGLI